VTPRQKLTIAVLGVLFLAAAGVALVAGPSILSAEVLELRAFRVAAAGIVGACLAVAGVVLQSMMRNPLASPDLLGVASGAGLAMSAASWIAGLTGTAAKFAGASSFTTLAAAGGALATLAVVYCLGRRRRVLDPSTVILVGVVIGILAASLTQLLQQLMPPEQGRSSANAFLGGIRENEVSWREVVMVAAALGIGTAVAMWAGPAMDAASMDDDEAMSVGVSLGRLRVMSFLVAGVLTAGAVVLAGPIGFVGLICPHFVRLVSGPRHQGLILGSALAGAGLLVLADLIVRLFPVSSGRLPLSVLTAMIGGPVLVHLLRSGRGQVIR
jgi:iron complex transport system permease protein